MDVPEVACLILKKQKANHVFAVFHAFIFLKENHLFQRKFRENEKKGKFEAIFLA